MPQETTKQTQVPVNTQETPAATPQIPIRTTDVIRDAAKLLEHQPEPAKQPPAGETPVDEELAQELKKKGTPKEKETKEETKEEKAPEPKKSKRELFKEKADSEKAFRDKEARLKEREAEVQKLEVALRTFQADPIAYLEKLNPRAYEEWTMRNLPNDKKSENSEIAELRNEIKSLKEELKGTVQTTQQEIGTAKYNRYMAEAKTVLSEPEFEPVKESFNLFEELLGQEIDVEKAVASVWAEYNEAYKKSLTPRECCEILLEDAQAHLERLPKSERLKALYGVKETPAETPPKKKRPPTGNTLTNAQETASDAARPNDFSHIKSRSELLSAVANTLEYADEET